MLLKNLANVKPNRITSTKPKNYPETSLIGNKLLFNMLFEESSCKTLPATET